MKTYKIIKIPERVSLYAEGKYQLKYPVGSIVSAPEGTLGIMCFSTEEHALKFIVSNELDLSQHTITEVEGLGKPLFPERISWISSENCIREFYRQHKQYFPVLTKPPEGTVCFPQIHVLG